MSKKRKRSVNALEDDEMNQKLRDGRPVKRNARQEKELAQLQEELQKQGNSTTLCGLKNTFKNCRQKLASTRNKDMKDARQVEQGKNVLSTWIRSNEASTPVPSQSDTDAAAAPVVEDIDALSSLSGEQDVLDLQDQDLSLNICDDELKLDVSDSEDFGRLSGCEAADDVCVKLNELIQTCKIPKDKIMYKYLKDTVHIMINYDHKYDPDVVEFFNTIEYLGGGSTVNFLRGPMFHGQGRGGIRNAEDAACNLGGPSKRTQDKKRGGYTTKSGVLKDLHLAFITLANENTSNVPPFIETESVKVIGVAMENDGTPLKPGIQFDDRMKTNVGLKQEVDIKFVRDNPNLRILRGNIITEANVSFITSLCNNLSMPIAVYYLTKSGKTGEDMKDFFLEQVKILQVCKACLERIPSDNHTVQLPPEDLCCSVCEECLQNGKVCDTCAERKQPSHIPSLRACKRCYDAGQQCVRCAVLVLTTDCEEGNKKAMELISKMQEERSIDPALQYLVFLS
ncbi:hypothetical protein OS493_012460 [Desmophyllum pertusum]|uniref:Uncharacterized protein n=1 Tax=Desmophyllum pertusum TaxID=174260 RepID=A0A9W9ZQL5_9CNID|nr:hypothetical protein OS493_012460 [Desmophyllum pertusum]